MSDDLPPGFVLKPETAPVQPPAAPKQAPAAPGDDLPPGFILKEAPVRTADLPAPGAKPVGFVVPGQEPPARPGGEFTLSNLVRGIYNSAVSAVTLPGDVYKGKVQTRPSAMTQEEGMRVADLAGFASPVSPGRIATQAEKSWIFADPRAGATRRAAQETVGITPGSVVTDAADMGITLTAGQRTADPALLSTENAMAGGAKGAQAQRIAREAADRQQSEIAAARDSIGDTAGLGQIALDRPADAGGLVGETVQKYGTTAQRELEARNLAEAQRVAQLNEAEATRVATANAAEEARAQAANEAATRAAQQSAEASRQRFNPQDLRPVDAGADVAEAVRNRATQGRERYQQGYREAFDREGQIDPGFFQGVARPGGQELTASGSPLNEFAAPISQRITEDLVRRAEPIIIDKTLTPLASATLNDLNRVASLNLGRIGQPGAGETVAGVNLRGIEQARKIITARIRAASATPEDARALRGVMDAFDNQLERGFDSVLFSGDEGALQGLRAARQQFRDYQQTFRPRAQGDDAGRVIQNIIERDASPEEVANYVIGSSRVGGTGTSVRTFTRLREILGADSPEMQAIQGATWQKLTGGLEAATPAGAQRLSERIREFTSGQGSTLARQMFPPDDLAAMRSFGDAMQAFARRAPERPGEPLPKPVPLKAAQEEATGHIKTLIDVANKRLSPEDTAAALFGYGNKITTANIRLVDAIASMVGRETPEWAAIRQGAWQRLTGVAEGKTEMGAQKVSQRILEFINGDGRTMARRLFSEEELSEMRRFAGVLKAIVGPSGTTNPSNSGNRLAGLARDSFTAIGTMLGVSAGGPVGAAAGYVMSKGVRAASDARQGAIARQLFDGREPVSIGSRLAEASAAIPPSTGLRAVGGAVTGAGQGRN